MQRIVRREARWALAVVGFVGRHLGPQGVMLVTALIVGLGAGLGAVIFRWLIGEAGRLSFEWLPSVTQGLGPAYIVIAPVVAGMIVGPMIYFFAREAKGHGVPEVMEAVALRGGRIRPIVAVVKSLASALTIGGGGSVGREGPIVQIGSTLGSTLGQLFRMSADRTRALVACGAAGGIAATFNAPIAGVVFALEVILGEFSVVSFGNVVIAAVMASVVGRAAFGDHPAFAVPHYAIDSLWEYPMYVALGLVAGVVGVVYTRMIYAGEDLFDAWRSVPEWVKPAVGGLVLGAVALAYGLIPGLGFDRVPQVYGVGYDTIEAGLLGQQAMLVMLALAGLKVLATTITLGSGGSGGIFAPSLFIGSMLGGAFGLFMQQLFPGLPGPEGAYALVGMGAVFAGATHASITAVIIMFEMTGDYSIVLPLMLAVVTGTLVSRRMLHGETIYTIKLTRRGVRLRRGQDVDVLERVRVREVMSDTVTVPVDTPAESLPRLFLTANRNAFPVLDAENRLCGIISLSDLREAERRDDWSELQVADLMSYPVVTAFPDEALDTVLQRMGPRDLSRLPVVAREDPTRLVGIVRRNDVVRAYNLALSRHADSTLQMPQSLRRLGPVEFVELDLPRDSPWLGKTVAEVSRSLPAESLLVSIRRTSGDVVFPHGDTRFEAGDKVVAYARMDQVAALRASYR